MPRPLVADEEMGLVPDDRATEGSAKQVVPPGRLDLSGSLRRSKEVRSLQRIVAEILVRIAMDVVSAALCGGQ